MWIIGLTGSIGMGKTTAGRILKSIGVPVHDSDAAVHRAFAPGGPAVADIERQFPGTVADGVVDRQALGKIVFHDDKENYQDSLGWHESTSSAEPYYCRPLTPEAKAALVAAVMTYPWPS